jgi:hypothetical protein
MQKAMEAQQPFSQQQFLSNIAQGTGSLGGSQSFVGGQGAYADGGEVMPGQSLLMMERRR